MTSAIAMMFGGALTNALAFTGSNFLFSQMGSSEERKRHNLAIEKLQHDKDRWNQERLGRIDYINQKLKEQGHAERTFQSVDEAMRQYNLLTDDKSLDYMTMPPEPRLEDYLDEDQKSALQNGELAVLGAGLLITGYLTWRYVKK
jgi:hypothetical protein